MIFDYFSAIRDTIQEYDSIVFDVSLAEKVYSNNKGFITGEIVFSDESKLKFIEVKEVQLSGKIKYSFHYMNGNNKLIFRYDNAKHYPNLSTFPHHKHTTIEVIESNELNLGEILSEIEIHINKK